LRVAIVDFDGTLYSGETFDLLMKYLKGHPTLNKQYKPFFRAVLPFYMGYKMKFVSEAKMKERSMQLYLSALKSLTSAEITEYFQGLSPTIKKGLNPSVVTRIQQHLQDEVHVMLVSGAYTTMLEAVTAEVNFDLIIGTDIPLVENRIDFSKPILHVQGLRKNEKILQSLYEKDIDWENSFAYGDSFSDLSVLELVGNPVAVKPDARLLGIAKDRQWEIL
jgi:HAD superfamily hydrolase (TIGR01490 family)